MVEGRVTIGYDHGYGGEVFFLGLALDPEYVEGFVEGCLERTNEDELDEEEFLWGLCEDADMASVLYRPLLCLLGGLPVLL